MKTLTRLIVENFQSHRQTEVKLGPGLNVIVGPSDFGKSALVRALRWLFYNEPRGANFIRVGARTCRVMAEFEDGTMITRLRTVGGRNQYILKPSGGEEEVFEGFGSEVPQEVVKASGVAPVRIDEHNRVELNFALQLEGPFLLAETGAVRAKVIGQLGGVHILDWAMRSTATDLHRLKEDEGRLSQHLEEVESSLRSYDHLPLLARKIEQIEGLLNSVEQLEQEIGLLENLRTSWYEIELGLSRVRLVINRLEQVGQGEKLLKQIEEINQEYQSVSRLSTEIGEVTGRLEISRRAITATEPLERIEEAIRNSESDLKELLALVQVEKELSQIERRLAIAEQIGEETCHLEEVDDALTSAVGLSRQWEGLQHTGAELAQVSAKLERMGTIAEATARLTEVEKKLAVCASIVLQLSELSRAAVELQVIKENIVLIEKIDSETINLEKVESALAGAGKAVKLMTAFLSLYGSWQEHQRDFRGVTLAAERYRAELEKKLGEFKDLLLQLGRCPVCYGILDMAAIERVLSEYE